MKSGVVTLRSLEMAGFKSFAKRTKLEFGAGLVAIVGPNGSGKSNIVDAVRWVFGEQKNRSLRTDRSEELIYHGGDGKARASMAEVVITLDNAAGKIPIELPEIEITRRLYRSGESNYLLNGRKVSLSSILELLAKSGFGVGSYTVVGQGLIEKLILATGQERKQLFEEASGIKRFEIKQLQTKKRLVSTNQNLDEINSMITELKPRQEALARQVSMVTKRNELTTKLKQLRHDYLSNLYNRASQAKRQYQATLDTSKKELTKVTKELILLEKSHKDEIKKADNSNVGELTKKLAELESERDKLQSQIIQTTVKAEQYSLQNLASTQSQNQLNEQIQKAQSSLSLHTRQQQVIQKRIAKYESKILLVDKKVQSQTKQLDKTRALLTKTQKTEYLRHSLGLINILQSSIEAGKTADELKIIFYKLRRMIHHSLVDNAAELALKVGRIQNNISALLDEREKLTESQTDEVIRLRASELDQASVESNLESQRAQLEALKAGSLASVNKGAKSLANLLKKHETQKSGILDLISKNQEKLASLANRTSTTEDDHYYRSHETLTSQTIVHKQSISQAEIELSDQNAKLDQVQQLKRSWYSSEVFAPTKQPKPAGIDEIRVIEAELSLLESIDPEIEVDFTQTTKRMEFLTSQGNDLRSALDNLEAVYAKTEVEMQKSFKTGFAAINHGFGKNFKALFGGGEARLELNEEDGGYGVEITVCLPSKKSQNLSSLSGGEKALASAALLAGILSANPSPFVVLDEVDAALDEENTKKFAKLLTNITTHSQVLVVTHNHDTMAVADELLGVTTAGNNESHIIRVNLDSLPVAS